MRGYRRVLGNLGANVGDSEYQFMRWFDLIGVQRHIKVLGIFARLWHRDGKIGYLADLPLTFEYVRDACRRYPELVEFERWLAWRVAPQLGRGECACRKTKPPRAQAAGRKRSAKAEARQESRRRKANAQEEGRAKKAQGTHARSKKATRASREASEESASEPKQARSVRRQSARRKRARKRRQRKVRQAQSAPQAPARGRGG